MTNEEKKAEFIKACEQQEVPFTACGSSVIPKHPIKMERICGEGCVEVIAFIPDAEFCFCCKENSYALSEIQFPKPAPVRIPWDASDFDKHQPKFLKHKVGQERMSIKSYDNDFLSLDKGKFISFVELANAYTLLDGTELYKESDK